MVLKCARLAVNVLSTLAEEVRRPARHACTHTPTLPYWRTGPPQPVPAPELPPRVMLTVQPLSIAPSLKECL